MSDGGGFTILEVEWTPLTQDELRLRRSGGVRRNTARTRNRAHIIGQRDNKKCGGKNI